MNADILNLLNEAADRYAVPREIVVAQAQAESGGNQYHADGSLVVSSAGAIGVMQLMPATAAGLGVDPTDAAQNIDGGVRYLAQLLRQFKGDVQLALAAYNWGPGHVSKHGYDNWPAETVAYVGKILKNAGSAITSAITDTPAPDVSSGESGPGSSGGSGPSGTGELILIVVLGGLMFWVLSRSMSG